MSTVVKMPRVSKTETDIAVLQVQMQNVVGKVDDLKVQVKEIHDNVDHHAKEVREMLESMRISSDQAHEELNKKISALEKWRYMMMGAGVAIGYFGFEFFGKLLQSY